MGRLLTTWESIFRLTELELERLLAEETCVVTTRGEQQSARSKPRDGGSPKCRVQATSNVWTKTHPIAHIVWTYISIIPLDLVLYNPTCHTYVHLAIMNHMSLNQFFFPLQGLHHASHLWARAERFALALVVLSFILIKKLLLLLSGDVESNPGPSGQHSEGIRSLLSLLHTYTPFSAVKETLKIGSFPRKGT